MRQLITSLTCFGLALVGCAGQAPATQGDDTADAGVDAAAETGQKVSGKTMDYFTAATPVVDAAITTDGVAPAMTGTSMTGGVYAIEHVPTGSKVYFSVASPLYRPTRNPPVTVEGAAVTQDLYGLTTADINRQYATANKPVGAGKAVLVAELKRNNGTPLEGIALTDVTLVDGAGTPAAGLVGPYFFGAIGDIDLALTTATAFGGRSRVALLDVPPGAWSLKVNYLDGQGATKTMVVPVTTLADGATLAIAGGMGGGGTTITNPKFTTDIYPRLQKAAGGGLGCANCHTAGGPAGNALKLDEGATVTLASMKAITGVIDLVAPAASLLLTKPLYEPAPYNHPNATFVDVNDPDYKLILLWIQQGALP